MALTLSPNDVLHHQPVPGLGPAAAPARAPDDLSDLPALPALIRCGSYDVEDENGHWTITGERWTARRVRESAERQSVNWDLLRARDGFGRHVLSERVVHSLKLVAARWSPRVSAADVHGRIYSAGRLLLQHLLANPVLRPADGVPFQWEHLAEDLVESLEQTARLSGRPGQLNTVNALRQWYCLMATWPDGTPIAGASPDLAHWWEGRTTKKGRGASRAASPDPVYGPLTLREIDALRQKCEAGTRADVVDRIVVWLLIVTLGRDIELRRLRRGHFLPDILPSTTPGQAPRKAYHLYKPQAKVGRSPRTRDARRSDDRARGHRRDDPRYLLPEALGQMIEQVLEPTYVTPKRQGGTGGLRPPTGEDAPLLYWLQGGSDQLGRLLARFVRAESVTTDRVLDRDGNPTPLVLDNYRFRHGVARVHQELGASDRELQRLLGHESVHTAREHYSAARGADAMVMERAAGKAVAPLVATMLTGQVEDPAEPRDLPVIPGAVPRLQRGRALKVIGNIGKCSNTECDKNPVVSCFGCDSYVGGPAYLHEIRELRDDVVAFLTSPEANEQSPHFVAQLRGTLAGIDAWIDFLSRAEVAAEQPDPAAVTLGRPRGRPRRATNTAPDRA
ncbi:hypothetical protein [Roseisolibacter agri]|uniref:Phage integrase family protein n=1 Tax=Roseisolibacter agri TaxID=2014610 RepID=A0AA37V0X7_9BACT|nr:hypothetical protein [Roseisolibacter agri]GLC25285.1 hypothetical protein rosag_17980 [Roseisolibacter agri]